MTVLRIAMLVLAIIHALFVAFTAAAGSFADGGDLWSRLLLIVVHPIGAVLLLLLALRPRLPTAALLVIGLFLLFNIAADLYLARLIAQGQVKGDWQLPLVFAIVPAVGILYGLTRLAAARGLTSE